jgi:transcriptional regulator with XRE-family HTH domain
MVTETYDKGHYGLCGQLSDCRKNRPNVSFFVENILVSQVGSKIMGTQSKASKPKKMSAQTLGQFIQELREHQCLSLRQLAMRARVSPSFLSLVERDKGVPSDLVLGRIAKALNVGVKDLDDRLTRVSMSDLRRLLERSPEFRVALSSALRSIKIGESSVNDLAARIAG